MMKGKVRGFKPGQPPDGVVGAWQRPTALPPRDNKNLKCANCNKTGHDKESCRSPKLEMGMRKCHFCDEAGHINANCPKRKAAQKKGNVNAITAEARPSAGTRYIFCVDGDAGSEEVKARRIANSQRPQPKAATFGDFPTLMSTRTLGQKKSRANFLYPCHALDELDIPNSDKEGANFLYSCRSLDELDIPTSDKDAAYDSDNDSWYGLSDDVRAIDPIMNNHCHASSTSEAPHMSKWDLRKTSGGQILEFKSVGNLIEVLADDQVCKPMETQISKPDRPHPAMIDAQLADGLIHDVGTDVSILKPCLRATQLTYSGTTEAP